MIVADVQKHPQAVLDFALDFSPWLATNDSISSVDWTVPAGLEQPFTAETREGRYAVLWIGGGTDRESYQCDARITTAAGRVDVKSIRVLVTVGDVHAQATFARRMLEKIEARLLGADSPEVVRYQIAGRAIEKISPLELERMRAMYQRQIDAAEVAAGVRRPGAGGVIRVRL